MHKKNRLLVYITLVISLIVSCSEPEKSNLCTDEIIDSLVSVSSDKDYSPEEFLDKIRKNGYVLESENENTRPKFVNMQFLFESTLASMLKNKQIKKAVTVIYTPKPSTPLRTDSDNLGLIIPKESLSDTSVINTVTSRLESLHEYLKNNGILYNVYSYTNDPSQIIGMDLYYENMKKYPNNLIDKPVINFKKDLTGASYLIQCNNGQKILFSISANQLDSDSGKKNWEIYYGSLEDEHIHSHFKILKKQYSKSEVNFDLNN